MFPKDIGTRQFFEHVVLVCIISTHAQHCVPKSKKYVCVSNFNLKLEKIIFDTNVFRSTGSSPPLLAAKVNVVPKKNKDKIAIRFISCKF